VVPSAVAALLANLASLLLFVAVVAAVSPGLLQATLWLWVAGVLGLLAAIAALWWLGGVTAPATQAAQAPQEERAFMLSHALLIAGLIAGVSLLAAWLEQLFGHTGALAAAVMVALAEVQAAAAGVAQLVAQGSMPLEVGRWGMLAVLGASCVSKGALALAVGGPRYGLLVVLGLMAMLAGGVLGLWVSAVVAEV